MNKIKQNKITFILILSAIVIIFSSVTILSLPVLFNYKSKVAIIEKNFYKSFKIYIKSYGNISYKPFPKPHLLVENARLNLSKSKKKDSLIDTSDLKIYISLRDIYLRSFNNLISTEISNANLEIKISDLKKFREHMYKKINKPIFFNNCKIFLKNKRNEVILISPIKKITYKINNKKRSKNLLINGKIFGLDFKSDWKRYYEKPKTTFHNISTYNPSIEIKNLLKFEDAARFEVNSQVFYSQDKLEYNIYYNDNKIKISSPNEKKINFNINSNIQLDPFYFEGLLNIKNKKVDKIIDNLLLYLILFDENYLGNFNGLLKIKFDNLNNKLIKKGEINFIINEKKVKLKKAKFKLDKIGHFNTTFNFIDNELGTQFISKNTLNIENHIEFAKTFQISSKKVKNIDYIYFDIVKNIGETDFTLKNVKIDDTEDNEKYREIFNVKNIQNLRSYVRKIID